MVIRGKKVLFVIAPVDFRDEELKEPKTILENAGAKTIVANTTGQPAKGMLGSVVKPDLALHQVNSKDFNAIVFVGGSGSAVYFNNRQILNLAKEFYNSGKLVAAICIAPTILVNAGILNGKKATAWPSERDNINAIGTYTGSDIEQDGKIITAIGPQAARKFGLKIVDALER